MVLSVSRQLTCLRAPVAEPSILMKTISETLQDHSEWRELALPRPGSGRALRIELQRRLKDSLFKVLQEIERVIPEPLTQEHAMVEALDPSRRYAPDLYFAYFSLCQGHRTRVSKRELNSYYSFTTGNDGAYDEWKRINFRCRRHGSGIGILAGPRGVCHNADRAGPGISPGGPSRRHSGRRARCCRGDGIARGHPCVANAPEGYVDARRRRQRD